MKKAISADGIFCKSMIVLFELIPIMQIEKIPILKAINYSTQALWLWFFVSVNMALKVDVKSLKWLINTLIGYHEFNIPRRYKM